MKNDIEIEEDILIGNEKKNRKVSMVNKRTKYRRKRRSVYGRNKGLDAKTIILRALAVLGTTLGMTVVCIYAVMFICTHGPSMVARDLFVLSVKESSAGGFLAYMVCSPSTIKEIEENNKVKDVEEQVDTGKITIVEPGNEKDKAVEELLAKEGKTPYMKDEGLLFYKVKGSTYAGYMVVVTDPSRVMVGVSGDYKGEPGMSVPDMYKKYNATLVTNAGGFEDIGGVGDGGTPLGIVISEGVLKYGSLNQKYELIGFDKDNKFVIGNMTGQQALDKGVRDAVSFGPFLVMNGKPIEIAGTGGGFNPRTAIGQRADGSVLLLIIDGRQAHSLGATKNDLVNEMMNFGAVNAANLDGGGSTVMYYQNKVYNKISSIYGTRGIPTCIVVK